MKLSAICVIRWIAYKNIRLSIPNRLPPLSMSILVMIQSQILFKRESLIDPAFSCSVESSPTSSVESTGSISFDQSDQYY